MNVHIKTIQNLANIIETGMKRGYTSVLILLILKKHPCHGYLIIKEIKKYTLGEWNPSSSTVYPLLESLNNSELVEYNQKIESSKLKKIYKITSKGREILKILLQKHQKIIDSINSMIFSTIGFSNDMDDQFLNEVENLIVYNPILKWANDESFEERIKDLRFYEVLTQKGIKMLNKYQNYLRNLLKKIKKETLGKKK